MTGADAARDQRAAADPAASAWVDASAGSGKTKVLVDRALRLLLGAGAPPTDPHRILCLTFTNAAAAEMASRLNTRLAEWAVASEDELDKKLKELVGKAPGAETRVVARGLLARVLDAPGGMPIMTIHAFCQSLLRRFPIEAEVPPWFEVLDERETDETMDEVQRSLIVEPGEELRPARDTMVRLVHETRITDLLRELAGERARFRRAIRRVGSLDALIDRTHEAIGIARGTDPEDVVRAACAPGAAGDEDALRALAAAMAKGSKRDKERAAGISVWLEADEEGRAARFDSYRRVFLTEEDEPRKSVSTKAVIDAAPDLADAIGVEQRRLSLVETDRRRAFVAAATTALLTFGDAVLTAYERRKRDRGRLDFDDLILEARMLLTRAGAEWVRYRLDGGLDHVLIDEAQDTNPEQWEVVRALTEEFFAGEGARSKSRTVFAVGDPKQSIYGFQRADPAMFSDMKEWFAKRVRGADLNFKEVPLQTSFRSTEPVLEAVDAVFAASDARSGVVFGESGIRHAAERRGQAGRVELWPPEKAQGPEPPEPWKPPVERMAEPTAIDLIVEKVADDIARLCDGSHRLESRDRPARPGDVLVLLRRRDPFLGKFIPRLKAKSVPVAGADRLKLAEHIAVMDLMALGRFLLSPRDDLSLAEALKSPLFGCDDDALFDIAHERGRDSLWRRLNRATDDNPRCADAVKRLGALLSRVDRVTPWELYADLLAADGGRRLFRARLGPEADEPLDEFLTQAMLYERRNPPTLQGLLHWLETSEVEVQRVQEPGGGGEVRVMSVHGAKGMQAPVVYLPDTTQTPGMTPHLVWSPDDEGDLVLWPVRKEHWCPLSRSWRESARRRDMDEYRRLLYVAMTRAEDRLIVCGWQTSGREVEDAAWHPMVHRALVKHPDIEKQKDGALALRRNQTVPPDRREAAEPEAAWDTVDVESWLVNAPPSEAAPAPPMRPSRGGPASAPEAEERGRRLHRALQAWPNLPSDLSAGDRARLERIVALVAADPVFAPLFGPDGVAEAWVGAPGPRAFSGRIDRLAVVPGAVLALDFKTGGEEAHAERPPAAHLRQMAAYRGALRAAFPGRPVRCALAWVDLKRLSPLDDSLLDAHAP